MSLAGSSVMDESGSFCCDANSQLLGNLNWFKSCAMRRLFQIPLIKTIKTIEFSKISGGAMVASLLTGGTSPSPIRPPNSGLPNTTTTFEVSEMESISRIWKNEWNVNKNKILKRIGNVRNINIILFEIHFER